MVYRVAEGGVVDGQVLNGAWHEVRRTPRARKFSDTAAFEHLGEHWVGLGVFHQHLHVRDEPLVLLELALVSFELPDFCVELSIVLDVQLEAEGLQHLVFAHVMVAPSLVFVRCAQAPFARLVDLSPRLRLFIDRLLPRV